jgi:3-mercaptopyruvate sulfurtransferase SseA
MSINKRIVIVSLALSLAAGLLAACNSRDTALSQTAKKQGSPGPQQSPAHNPADEARRITAQELYELYRQDKVLIIDTRNEAAFKESRIKGAILIPAGDFEAKADELPRDKMIVAYCT